MIALNRKIMLGNHPLLFLKVQRIIPALMPSINKNITRSPRRNYRRQTMCETRGGGGQGIRPLPLKNHKNKGFFSNSGPDPLKNHKAAKWRFTGGPMMALF